MTALIIKPDERDLRNTKGIDVVRELAGYHARVDIDDPWTDVAEAALCWPNGLELSPARLQQACKALDPVSLRKPGFRHSPE